MNEYGFKNCIVIYTTVEKVKYDAEGNEVGRETSLTGRKVDLEDED